MGTYVAGESMPERDNTHDLFIRTITPISPKEGIEGGKARMDRFVREMMRALNAFLGG